MSASETAASARRDAWSRYWQQGALHSLPGSFADNYSGTIARFWAEQLQDLRQEHRLLDVATGNGAIPQLVCGLHAAAMPRVDAVDLARLAPAWMGSEPLRCQRALHFHSGVRAEELPFAAASFDLVSSQYGIEYTDLERSVPEVARVLRPQGRMALIVHHAESRLARVAREELRLSDWLLEPHGFAASVEAAVAGAAETRSDGAQSLQQLRTDLAALAAASPFPDLLHEADAFAARTLREARQGGAALALAHCRHWRTGLEDARLRYRELCTHALDATGIVELAERCARHGLTDSRHAPISHDNGMLMGWTFRAQKS